MKFTISEYLWLDGEFLTHDKAHVPITTHAMQYGTSVFEGIRGYGDSQNLFIFRLDDHIKRFRKSGGFYNIALNYTDQEISNAIIQLCKKNDHKQSVYIRPFYFVGEYGINLNVTKESPTHLGIFTLPLGDMYSKTGISTKIVSWRKFADTSIPTQAKMGGNYLNSIIAIQEAKRDGYDEALLLDQRGNLSEGSGENVFIVKNDQVITPPLSSSALDGITRDTVMRIAQDRDIRVIEQEITKSMAYTADEVFLSGTAAEIIPVHTIDQHKIGDGTPGAITKYMMTQYDQIVRGKISKYSDWITVVH